jgi:hypothetical protein
MQIGKNALPVSSVKFVRSNIYWMVMTVMSYIKIDSRMIAGFNGAATKVSGKKFKSLQKI